MCSQCFLLIFPLYFHELTIFCLVDQGTMLLELVKVAAMNIPRKVDTPSKQMRCTGLQRFRRVGGVVGRNFGYPIGKLVGDFQGMRNGNGISTALDFFLVEISTKIGFSNKLLSFKQQKCRVKRQESRRPIEMEGIGRFCKFAARGSPVNISNIQQARLDTAAACFSNFTQMNKIAPHTPHTFGFFWGKIKM